jgi:putative flippase GtrA
MNSAKQDRIRRIFRGDWIDRALVIKVLSFGLVGLINSALDLAVFSLAYFGFGLHIVAANIAAWVVAVSGSYVMNAKFTFAAESGRALNLKTYLGFAVAQLGGLAANTATVLLASYFLVALVDKDIAVLIGKILAIGASFVVNFTAAHIVIFRRPPTRQ